MRVSMPFAHDYNGTCEFSPSIDKHIEFEQVPLREATKILIDVDQVLDLNICRKWHAQSE
jgi:hypothetical protein